MTEKTEVIKRRGLTKPEQELLLNFLKNHPIYNHWYPIFAVMVGTGLRDKFDWPDLSAPQTSDRVFCYGLKDQIGVLCDGTVVPCCLDHEGDISLGNLFTQDLEQILNTSRAKAMEDGFRCGYAAEELCRRCGYAGRFQK